MADEKRKRRWVFGVLAGVVVALVLWFIFHKPAKPEQAPAAVPITAARAAAQNLPVAVTALGAAKAWTSDTIFSQASGKLIGVYFREGDDVRAGQLLAEVDPAPYRAALQQALGTLHRDQAVLAGAKVDLARYALLAQQDSIAGQTVADQRATVAQDAGTVEVDRGAVATARINLSYCRITAPVSGRAGIRLVDPGNLVSTSGSASSQASTASATSNAAPPSGSSGSSGGSGIVTINQMEPIAVTFTVPEGEFQHLNVLTQGFRHPLGAQAFSQESGALLDSGIVGIADNNVDQATGSVELKARFGNGARLLWPGQFVNVKLAEETLANVTIIPIAAIAQGPSGQYVFVVGPGGKAAMRPVTTLLIQGNKAVVKSGVKPGEVVVTDGQVALKPGAKVRIVGPVSTW